MALEVGDVVYLKSGSPNMTVISLAGPQDEHRKHNIKVAWFNTTTADAEPYEASFPEEALTVKEAKTPVEAAA